jgi:hypothetical protein
MCERTCQWPVNGDRHPQLMIVPSPQIVQPSAAHPAQLAIADDAAFPLFWRLFSMDGA